MAGAGEVAVLLAMTRKWERTTEMAMPEVVVAVVLTMVV